MLKQTIQRARFLFRAFTLQKLNVLDQLEADHMKVELLFVRWKLTRDAASRELIFDQIRKELQLHMHLEETLFYPACEKVPELKDYMKDAYHEHKEARNLLKELSGISFESERASTKMKNLFKLIEHHVHDEENELFPRVEAFMKKSQIEKLSRELRQKKKHSTDKMAA